eukprot:581721-Pyramimonas_sp.AAC.1
MVVVVEDKPINSHGRAGQVGRALQRGRGAGRHALLGRRPPGRVPRGRRHGEPHADERPV